MSFFGKSSGGEPRITFEHIDLGAEPRVPAPAAAVPAMPGAMLLAADSEVEGELRSRGAVRVEGVLRGGLKAPLVFLELGGLIEGHVTAERVRIAGTLRGTVTAREIEVSRSAVLEAELVYDEISIERGAKVRGLHRQREPEPEMIPAVPAPQEMADTIAEKPIAVPQAEDALIDPAVMLAAAASTAALVAEAEAALQELAQVSQAAAGAAAELADQGVEGLVTLEQDLRAAPERLLSTAKAG